MHSPEIERKLRNPDFRARIYLLMSIGMKVRNVLLVIGVIVFILKVSGFI